MLKKIISLIFALTLIAMLATTAVAMEPRASKLIISHSCVASADADGEINVTFSITGKGIMSRIGAQSMYFYVKSGSAWTLEKSYGQYSAGRGEKYSCGVYPAAPGDFFGGNLYIRR